MNTYKESGFTIKLIQDDDASSPKDDSDDHQSGRVFLVTTKNRDFVVEHDLVPVSDRTIEIPDSVRETHHIYPLNAYIHSVVALSLNSGYPFNDQWDSGQIGFVFVTKDTNEIGNPLQAAESLVKQWNQYLSGDVWGYVIEDENGKQVESCWGFYGEKYALEEARYAAKSSAEYRAEQEAKIDAMMHV
jgi:hypothetical protein